MDWRERSEASWIPAYKGTLKKTRNGGGAPQYICKFCGRWIKSTKQRMQLMELRCKNAGCQALQQIDEPGESYQASQRSPDEEVL